MVAEQLHVLAKQLRLTKKQRTFAEAYAADPNCNISAAARAAGSRGKAAGPDGHQILSLAKVQTYIKAINSEAQQAATRHTENSVMSVAELMQRVTLLARHDAAQWLMFIDHDQRELGPDEKSDRELQRAVFVRTSEVDGKKETKTEVDGPRRTTCCCCGGRGDHWNPISRLMELPTPERMADDFVFNMREACARGLGPQVEGISFDKDGRPKLKFVDKLGSLALMAKLLGLDRDGAGDEPESVRLQREAYREALKIPEVAKALDKVTVEVERVTERLLVTRSGS